MNLGGWVIMILSVGGTTGSLLWCIWRVMAKTESPEKLHRHADLHTPDENQ